MCGVLRGAAGVIVAWVGGSDAGGPDSGSGETLGASFADSVVGPVVGACAGGPGDAIGASGTASVEVAGTGCGVVDKLAPALVSASAAFSRCHRLGNAAAGSAMPASGNMT